MYKTDLAQEQTFSVELDEFYHPDLFQDSEGRSPIHIAITSKHPIVTRLLLSHPELNMNLMDRSGQTPFAVALRTRDHDAAGAILAREPGAAEQVTEKLLWTPQKLLEL